MTAEQIDHYVDELAGLLQRSFRLIPEDRVPNREQCVVLGHWAIVTNRAAAALVKRIVEDAEKSARDQPKPAAVPVQPVPVNGRK